MADTTLPVPPQPPPAAKRRKGDPQLTTTALAPWFGSNRMLAKHVGEELSGCTWVGVPFAGGMCELAHIGARSLVVNDLHRHVINLAQVAAHPSLGPKLYRQLKRLAFHPLTLRGAQERCREREQYLGDADELFAAGRGDYRFDGPNLEWAVDYFVSQWMNRSGVAGTDAEFRGNLPVRWDAGGGDSATRFNSAVGSLVAWRRIMRRCNFTAFDCFDFLADVHDDADHGIYCDPPFPEAGDDYKHKFTTAHQVRLAETLARFEMARVIIRYHDHPLIRGLYPESRWTWVRRVGRTQTNGDAAEVLILNGRTRAAREVA